MRTYACERVTARTTLGWTDAMRLGDEAASDVFRRVNADLAPVEPVVSEAP